MMDIFWGDGVLIKWITLTKLSLISALRFTTIGRELFSGAGTFVRLISSLFVLCRENIHKYYPNRFIRRDDTERFYILNTLFNLSGVMFTSKTLICQFC